MYRAPQKYHTQSGNEGYRYTSGRASAQYSILQVHERHNKEQIQQSTQNFPYSGRFRKIVLWGQKHVIILPIMASLHSARVSTNLYISAF